MSTENHEAESGSIYTWCHPVFSDEVTHALGEHCEYNKH